MEHTPKYSYDPNPDVHTDDFTVISDAAAAAVMHWLSMLSDVYMHNAANLEAFSDDERVRIQNSIDAVVPTMAYDTLCQLRDAWLRFVTQALGAAETYTLEKRYTES